MTTPDPNILQSLSPQDLLIINLDRRVGELGRSVQTLSESFENFREDIHEELQDLRRENREVRASRWELEEKQLQDALARKNEEAEHLKTQIKNLESMKGSTNDRIDRAVTLRLQEEHKKRQESTQAVKKDLTMTGARAVVAIVAVVAAAAILVFIMPLLRNFFDLLLAGFGVK